MRHHRVLRVVSKLLIPFILLFALYVQFHGDFGPGGGFRTTPPSPNASGYEAVDELYSYFLYTNWTSPTGAFRGARALVATIKHPVPFFDDSYAVDSPNVGPYGSAVIKELIPEIERRLLRSDGCSCARAELCCFPRCLNRHTRIQQGVIILR